MKKWIIRNKLYFIGAVLGATGGYAYYKLIGCTTGTCLITSRPVNSTLYFAMMGALFFGIFKNEKNGTADAK